VKIWSIDFNFDGNYLISGASDSKIKIWDVKKLKKVATLKGHLE
jgi:WD40 repeat protein